MDNSHQDQNRKTDEKKPRGSGGPNVWLLVAVLLAMAMLVFSTQSRRPKEVSYTFFKRQLDAGKVEWIRFEGDIGEGKFNEDIPVELESVKGEVERDPTNSKKEPKLLDREFSVELPIYLSEAEKEALTRSLSKLEQEKTTLHAYDRAQDNSAMFVIMVSIILPLLLFFFLWMMFRRTRDQIMGGGFLSGFGKSPAKKYESTNQPITFEEVAGLKSVKEDLQEIIEFLKNPEKFQRLGGRVPKGVLLNGPPGTGKTLLARAVAGEAGSSIFQR